jgi:hypothetical protein
LGLLLERTGGLFAPTAYFHFLMKAFQLAGYGVGIFQQWR